MYKVKWTSVNGETKYGIYHGEKCYFNGSHYPVVEGNVYVEEALNGNLIGMKLSDLQEIESVFGIYNSDTKEYDDADEFITYVTKAWKEAIQKDKDCGNLLIAGRLIEIPVADSFAYYVVTKMYKKTLQIEWRGFSLDRWVDRFFGYGGKFSIETIQRCI